MKVYQYLFFPCLLGFLFSSSIQAQSKYNCEIYGKITQKLPKDQLGVVIVLTPDFFNKELYSGDIQQDGTYRVRFKKYFAGIVFFKFNQTSEAVFIRPGEKLQINFDPNDFRDTNFEFAGNGSSASFNRAMSTWEKQRIPGSRFAALMKDLNFAQVQDSVTKFKREEMKRLQKFCLSNQCPSKFLKWARMDILYREANELMRFRWYQPILNGQSPLKVIPKGYNYQFTRKFSLHQPLAMNSQNYRDYIHEHNMHWHYVAYSQKALNPENIDREKEFNWIVQNVKPGLALDLMLAENYSELAQKGNDALLKKLTPQFLAKMSYQPAKDYIQYLLNTK
ncbi:MAG TPA: hypothetical protein DCS93_04015 [Microscillaceae bacterium]|nr:hypothetical protein [Microscillaceae bacterium]